LRHALGDGGLDAVVRRDGLAMQVLRLVPGGAFEPGVIRVGAQADLIVVDRDPLSGPPEALSTLRVLATINAGRITYRASTDAVRN